MKRVNIRFKNEYVLQGAREEANRQRKCYSEYVEELIIQDLKKKRQYKIIAHYSNGDIKEETDFFTENDLHESIVAYGMTLYRRKPLLYYHPQKIYLTGFEVWKYGKIIAKEGDDELKITALLNKRREATETVTVI